MDLLRKNQGQAEPCLLPNCVQIGDAILVGNTFVSTGKLGVIEFQNNKDSFNDAGAFLYLFISNPDTYPLNSNLDEIPTLKINGVFKYT